LAEAKFRLRSCRRNRKEMVQPEKGFLLT